MLAIKADLSDVVFAEDVGEIGPCICARHGPSKTSASRLFT